MLFKAYSKGVFIMRYAKKLFVNGKILRNRRALHLNLCAVARRFDNKAILFKRYNSAANTADSYDFVADLKIIAHFFLFFLLLSLRTDKHEVHKYYHTNKHNNGKPTGSLVAAGS